ncbi:thiamine phosphate synthase [Phascolarctobacterium sp.]|uniref:thiamine phosphate synthase n=1 Tax=Phascolarctobacterium sp. TaxID=2049039 RepID=UPI002A83E878|nr:thiamine phosphate synthase [Phascolarctobacterium sp.]MDY5044798.1 thiamine phosphate synthase [Phascolarctobacterium sp.]
MNEHKKYAKENIDYSIYLLTDDTCLKGRHLLACVEQALQGGVTLVQYRSKFKDGGPMYQEALALKALCDKYNVPLIINDRVDVALAVSAAGVHVGQDDLPCSVVRALAGEDFVIGVSAHNPEEARSAMADGADYLGCGAVFGTATKPGVAKLGLANLQAIRSVATIPMVGIGGVNASNYAEVLATGANGAAIISGILAAEDIKTEVGKFVAVKSVNNVTVSGAAKK